MSFFFKRPFKKKPSEALLPDWGHPFFDKCLGFWQLSESGDIRNYINGVADGNRAATTNLTAGRYGKYLRCDGVNSAFNRQTLRGVGNYYTAPADFTDIALIRPHAFENGYFGVIGHALGLYRNCDLRCGSPTGAGTMFYSVDATTTDAIVSTDRDDNLANWGWGILAGGSKGSTAWIAFYALPGEGTGKQLYNESSESWGGNTGGETVSIGHQPRSNYTVNTNADILWASHLNRALDVEEIRELSIRPFDFWEHSLFVPVGIAGPITHTGTGTLQAGDASVSGTGDVLGAIVGDGALQAQPASVSGVGDLIAAIEGTGTLQAGAADVSGVGAIVQDGTGALQAQDATVSGVGEVGNVRTGTGTLQAGDANVSGAGDLASVGTGALQAQDAAVVGIGEVEGLTTGTGTLQAQSAAVSGVGEFTFEGTGTLQAQSASVAGIGFNLGELTLTPGDLAAIQQVVWSAPEAQDLIAKVNEIWQRRGLDSANPQTYDKAGKQIRVGAITIDLTGNANEVTQTRQP